MLSLFVLFILILPLALAPLSSAEPATPFASLYLVLFLVFAVVWTFIKGLSQEKLRPLKYPLILVSLLLMIAVACSLKRAPGLEEIFRYALGLILFVIIAPLSENDKKRLFPALLGGALLISVLALHQYYFGFTLLQDYVLKEKITDPFVLEKIAQRRVFFPFPTPGILGGYLAMILPLAFRSKKGILLSLPLIFALLLTKSLGALLSIAIVVTVLFLFKTHLPKKRALLLLLLGAVLGGVFVLRTHNSSQHLLPAFSAAARLGYWRETWEIIRAHPLTGIGLGNFDLPKSLYAHNFLLQLWAEAGLAGIVSFFWLVAATLKSGWKRLQESHEKSQALGLLTGISIFFVHNLMDVTFFLPATSLMAWVLMGLFYAPPKDLPKNPV